MGTHIIDIEGIGPKYAEKLEAIGILTIEQLLEKGASQDGRKELEKETEIDGKRILDWIGMADMYRIKGVGKQFAELLKATGVDTVKELRTRNAQNLEVKLQETNEEKKLTRAVPSLPQIQNWISQASELEAKLTY
jgi:predicted flap endonuclease-1-like 5' DNA nuclease